MSPWTAAWSSQTFGHGTAVIWSVIISENCQKCVYDFTVNAAQVEQEKYYSGSKEEIRVS